VLRTRDLSAAAYGIYSDAVEVAEVVRTLNTAGFENEHICLMLAPTHPIATIVRDANILNQECEASVAIAGLIGWLSEFGAVVIPSVGFFIRSQAFFRALLVARDAPAFSGNSGTLAGLGFPGSDADRFAAQLQQAGFLVYVASPEVAKAKWALQLLRITGADESATLETKADAAVA
jgi:hypothetical protein